jgi:negative regulator of flagellin synthesis FlgM
VKIIGPEHQQAIKQTKLEKSVQSGGDPKDVETAGEAGTSVPTEKVQVSGRGRDIQKVRDAVSNVPEIRQEKVAEIKEKIANGEYRVRSEDIARKIIEDILKTG